MSKRRGSDLIRASCRFAVPIRALPIRDSDPRLLFIRSSNPRLLLIRGSDPRLLLNDLDHVPDYVRQHGPASPTAIWRHYRSGNGEGRLHGLHRWPMIL